jgi:hypothetical protein
LLGCVAFPGALAVLVSDLHVGREGHQSQREEKDGQQILDHFQPFSRGHRVLAVEDAPLDRQAVHADRGVDLDGKEQHEIKRPHHVGPEAVRRGVGPDAARLAGHDVQVHRTEKEHHEAADGL